MHLSAPENLGVWWGALAEGWYSEETSLPVPGLNWMETGLAEVGCWANQIENVKTGKTFEATDPTVVFYTSENQDQHGQETCPKSES